MTPFLRQYLHCVSRTGRRVLAVALGMRGETMLRGPPGTRPELREGGREGEGERAPVDYPI